MVSASSRTAFGTYDANVDPTLDADVAVEAAKTMDAPSQLDNKELLEESSGISVFGSLVSPCVPSDNLCCY